MELRNVTLSDMLLIFNWANDPVVRAQSFNSEPIKLEDHEKWFNKVLKDESVQFYILMDREEPVGQIRLAIEQDAATISYMIASEFRGKGYGKNIIKCAETELKRKKTPVIKMIGEVKKTNEASARVFESCGFTRTEEKDNLVFVKNI